MPAALPMDFMAYRNAVLLARWKARRAAFAVYPDAWPAEARSWFERLYRQRRLLARQFLSYLKSAKRARAIERAHARWHRRPKVGGVGV